MKSLILKDLLNIGHNAKSMFFMLLVFACITIPQGGAETCIVASGILCSMMVITTFSFDEQSKWTKYAMIMPVSKKDYVISKFIVLAIFSLVGVLVGTVLGTIGGLLLHKINSVTSFLMSLGATAIGFIIADIFGSVSIPLLFKFGAEKARMMTLIAFVVPVIVCYGAYQLLIALGVSFTTKLIVILLCASPVITAVWNYVMYKISYWIFDNKELLN